MVKSLSTVSYRLVRRLSLLLYSGDLGISITGEWTTSRELTSWFGMAKNMTDIIRNIDVSGWEIWRQWIIVEHLNNCFVVSWYVLDMILKDIGEIKL